MPQAKALAQVTSSPTAAGANRALAALRRLMPAPLTGVVEPATVNGAKVYRANVGGFASLADARAFCATVAAVTKTCWAHPVARKG